MGSSSNADNSKDSSKYRPLHGAILNSPLKEVKEYFIKDKDALTVKINDDDDSPLHVGISTCKNLELVEYLLKEIDSESLVALVCKRQQNQLHRAAFVGNTDAAKMLVEKNPKLLYKTDKKDHLPIHKAIFGAHADTFKYLLEVTIDRIKPSQQDPFKEYHTAALLNSIISNGLFKIAYELIKNADYRDMARTKTDTYIPLKSIAGKSDAYLSGTKYNFYQKFVYQYVPIEDPNLDNAHVIDHDIENQAQHTTTPIAKGTRSCCYSGSCF